MGGERRWPSLQVPTTFIPVSDSKLANGIRLIVRTDTTSPTVTVMGTVKHDGDLQTPPGQDGVGDVLDGLFSYGTTSLDRIAFQKALDDIAANESAGFSFSVKVLKEYFSRGVQLLADNELHPALPDQAFVITRQQYAQFVAGQPAESGISHFAGARSGAAAEGRSGAARGDSGHPEQADSGRGEAVSRRDHPAGSDDDCGDRRRDARGGEGRD